MCCSWKKIDLPEEAYYKPGKRYRADKLINYLAANRDKISEVKYTKILGITEVDISTTKGEIEDWGILGQGAMNGSTCVVSTFRMRKKEVSHEVFMGRITNVVQHELGHLRASSLQRKRLLNGRL
jgi:archaemetzincin